MPGMGQEQQLISVPQSPLVTPAVPVGQDAVNSMVDAFRKGQITSQDLVDHYGMKARAETQLGTAQAEAALPLVEPTAQLQQAKMASELAQTNWGQNSLKTAQETMGWFGDDINNYIDPATGKTDFQKLAKVGAQRVATLGQVDKWANMLKPVSSRVVKLGDGSEVVQYLNSLNQDVTPPADGYDGSEQYWHYVTQLEAFMPKSHPLAGVYPTKYDASLRPYDPKNSTASAAGHPTGAVVPRLDANALRQPVVLPKATPFGADELRSENPQLSEMRANLVTQGKSVAEANAMTAEQVVAASPMKDVVAAAAAPAPTITPSSPLPAPPQTPPVIKPKLQGIPIKSKEQTVFTADKVREGLMKEVPYQSWQKSIPYATTFEKNADRVKSMTPQQQGQANMNMTDLGLAESLIKLYDPEGVIREFKWEKFETQQPRVDLLKNAWDLAVNRRGSFTPETRKLLVDMGEEVIRGREDAARPSILKALEQVNSNPNINPKTVFTSDDERVAAAKAVAQPASAPGSNSPGPGWTQIQHPTLGRIWRKNGSNMFVPVR